MSSPDTTAPRQGLGWRLALLLVAVLLVAGYALAALSYGASLNTPTLSTAAPSGGVAVTFAPQQLLGTSQQAVGYLLLFPDAGLLDADDTLRADITVTFEPTVGAVTVIFRQGQAPAPQRISLPTPGVVEEYPFDSYQIDAVVRAAVSASDATGGGARSLPVTTDLLFRIPGWRTTTSDTATAPADASARLTATVARSGSTIAIAAMILILMLALAVIAAMIIRAHRSHHPVAATA